MVKRSLLGAIALGIPVAALWAINLPYPVIRRPVARTAPILLLPSYISMDHHYRQAISLTEQAEQLMNSPTSFADIELGAQKVEEAQTHLDKLPLWFLNDWGDYRYWWYSWRFSMSQFDASRAQIGTLQAKIFQEQNAYTAYTAADQAVSAAKQQYQKAVSPTDKKAAIASWQTALNQLDQIPSQTFAGQTAQKQLVAYRQDFQDTVGVAADSDRTNAVITASREFAMKAAQAGQNPPHSVEEWRQIEALWSEALTRLGSIPPTDVEGYAEAQQLMAIYRDNLRQISIRRSQEEQAVAALQSAQTKIERLLATPGDRNYKISQLQSIINELKRIPNGTTAYLEAQSLLVYAQNALSKL
ncbi:MAG: hypothetical protein IGR76_08715 [Synechococcales cyanobacterium T60_A2020_003]|nr:hypothetical protein [Synechococcales cyanobacterium T60_A2020_003]